MRSPTFALLVTIWAAAVSPAAAQSVLERSPNIQGVWGLPSGYAAFVFAHRFEVMEGGDELFSVPTLTLAAGLPLGLTAGLDFTSYSEAIPGQVTGNETQIWLKRPFAPGGPVQAAAMVAYNTAAESADAAIDLRVPFRRLELYAEGRGYSSLFGTGDAAASGTLGAAIRINRYLAITGDVGRVLTEDAVPTAWSGALAIGIPRSPHTLSLIVTNSGATTLQGATRRKTVGPRDLRYGFSFTVPLGNAARWWQIFSPSSEDSDPPEAAES